MKVKNQNIINHTILSILCFKKVQKIAKIFQKPLAKNNKNMLIFIQNIFGNSNKLSESLISYFFYKSTEDNYKSNHENVLLVYFLSKLSIFYCKNTFLVRFTVTM